MTEQVLHLASRPPARTLALDAEPDHPWVIPLGQTTPVPDPAKWLHDKYGAAVCWKRAEPHPDGKYIYRLVGFYEHQGTNLLNCMVIDHETREPLVGKAALRWWPDAPELGDVPPPASKWLDRGCPAYVKADGRADWSVGRGEAYFPSTGSGICKVWVCTLDGPCDLFEGWGWLDGTNYWSLVPVFERFLVEDDPEPEPEGDLEKVIQEGLEAIAAAIEKPRTIS